MTAIKLSGWNIPERTIYTPYADIRDFGASPTSDNTVAIQGALDQGTFAYVPPGVWPTQDTINITSGRWLQTAPGSCIKRIKSSNVSPLAMIMGQDAGILGPGWWLTENISPNGILYVGPKDSKTLANIIWTVIDGARLSGIQAPESVGLMLKSSEGTVGGANYMGSFKELCIREVGTGVSVGPICNAHNFNNCKFYLIGSNHTGHSYHFVNNCENTVSGGFTHLSKMMDSIFRFQGCEYNLVNDVIGEPGVPDSYKLDGKAPRYFRIDDKCKVVRIVGHDNCINGPENLSPTTIYLNCGELRGVTLMPWSK